MKLFIRLILTLAALLPMPRLLAQPGTVDAFEANPDAYAHIYATATQMDGKVLIAGDFITINGVSRPAGIARLNADGSLDMSFDPAISGGTAQVYALAALPDGKILIGGSFHGVGAWPTRKIARLNADGTVDSIYLPNPDSTVYSIVPLPDGKVIIGGAFTLLGPGFTITCEHVARINADGTVDTSFTPPTNAGLTRVAVQPNGKVIIAGYGNVGGITRSVARLNTDGTLDGTFAEPNADSTILCVQLQGDGKIIIGGGFENVGGVNRPGLARLNSDGSHDTSFITQLNSGAMVHTSALQTNGHLVFGGIFHNVNGSTRNSIARVLSNGVLDPVFDPNSGGSIWATALQGDGRVITTGAFHHVSPPFLLISGVQRNGIARLFNDILLDDLTVPSQTTISWARNGSAPEATNVRCELSTDGGSTWSLLGHAARSGSDWQLTSLALPLTGIVRTLATVQAPQQGGMSSSIVVSKKSYQFAPAAQVVTLAASNQAAVSATLNASVDANSDPTTVSFHYGLTTAYGSTLSATLTPNDGASPIVVSASATALTPHVEYHCRVVATNSSGTSYGEDETFVSNAAPPLPTLASNTVTENNAPGALIGGLGPTTDSDGDAITYSLVSGPGDSDNFAFTIVGNELRVINSFNYEMQSTFSVRIRASDGFLQGSSEASLTILVLNQLEPPTLVTLPAAQVRHSSAALKATVNANSVFTMAQFEWGETIAYGNTVPLFFFPADGNSAVPVETFIGGLTPGATYHYRITASNADGSSQGADQTFTTRATTTGDVELAFNPMIQGNLTTIATQTDGKILVGGYFFDIGGVPRDNLARLYPDGTLDASFNPAPDGGINAIGVQRDGKIIVGGFFGNIAGSARNNLARLNADGTLDPTFSANTNGTVNVLAVRPGDNGVFIAGTFSTVNGVARDKFAKLLPSGALDPTLPNLAPNGSIFCMAFDQSTNPTNTGDGALLVGGDFSQIGGSTLHGLARIYSTNASGLLLPTTEPGTVITSIARTYNDFVITGNFTSMGGLPRQNAALFSQQGILQGYFAPSIDGGVYSIAVQSDGKIIIAGMFSSVNSQPIGNLARLNPDGSLDSTFDPGPRSPFYNPGVLDIALEPDGKLLAAGSFSHLGGEERMGFGRLHNDPPGTVLYGALAFGQWTIRWERTGSAPMINNGTLYSSIDSGSSWQIVATGPTTSFMNGALLPGGGIRLFNQQPITTPRLWRVIGYTDSATSIEIGKFQFPSGTVADWRMAYFGSADGTGSGADDADPDMDGVENLLEYAFNTSPLSGASRSLPEGVAVPDGMGGEYFEIRFTQPPGITGVTYGAEWSATLVGASWTPVPDTGVLPEHVFRVPIVGGMRGFMRVIVTRTP